MINLKQMKDESFVIHLYIYIAASIVGQTIARLQCKVVANIYRWIANKAPGLNVNRIEYKIIFVQRVMNKDKLYENIQKLHEKSDQKLANK